MFATNVGHLFSACCALSLTVTAAYPWNPDYYYDDTPYFGESDLDHIEPPSPIQVRFPTFPRQQCNCIKLRECTTLTHKIHMAPKPLSVSLMKDIRKKACGFAGIDPLVCCPSANVLPRSFREVTTDKPWIWDVTNERTKPTKPSTLFTRLSSDHLMPNAVHNTPKPQKNHRRTKKRPYFEFEDPQTFRNCPPSFSPHFRLPSHFQDIKPIKNMHHVPYDFKYGLDSNYVDNEPNFIFPNFPDSSEDVPTFPSRVAKYPLEKLGLVNTDSCGISIDSRIIGGDDAVPGQFPWMARLAYRNRSSQLVSYRCSGSVISNKYVLTAAHCVTNLVDDLELVYVRLGELDSRTNLCDTNRNLCTVRQDYEIESIVHHPNYDMPKYANDVALIRLKHVTNSSFISPLCLPLGNYEAVDKNLNQKTGIVAGWGVSTLGGADANPMLQYLQLPLVNTKSCADSYARFSANSRSPIIINDSQICAQGTANRDACQGDSGGPIMREDKRTGRFVLLGLVSFGPRTGGVPSFPGVYSRTSSHLDWILSNLQL